MESINSNQFQSNDEVIQNNISVDGPPSPILSTNKINRRIIINRKLNKQKSKIKLVNQFGQDIEQSNSSDQGSCNSEYRLRAIEKLKSERKKYYNLLCSMNPANLTNNICKNEGHKETSIVRQDQHVETQERKISVPNQENMKFSIHTAAGQKVEIPEHVINEYKYIFDDILNDQESNLSVLKCPVKSNIKKSSRIPIWNQSTNVTSGNSIVGNNEETFSQLEAIKEIVSDENFENSFCITPKKKEVTFQSPSGDNVLITESFIDAAENMLEEDRQMEMIGSEYVESNFSTNTMNHLYSNQKFEEYSTTGDSLGCFSYKNSVKMVDEVSEISVESSQFYSNFPESHISENTNNNTRMVINNKDDDHIACEELSITDIINDDWSDSIYDAKSDKKKKKTILPGTETENYETKNLQHSTLLKNHKKVNSPDGIALNSEKIKHCNRPENTTDTTNQNIDTSEYVNNGTTICKSIINLSIPISKADSHTEALDPKNLIELHRNKNFVGNSEESCSNIDYKVSQHSIHIKSKCLKSEMKLLQNDFIGFTRNEQEVTDQKAIVVANNIKQIEKEIIDKELLIQARSNCDKNTKIKKGKRYKSENGKIDNDKEKNSTFSTAKECKIKNNKKKRGKGKYDKIKTGEEDILQTTCEQVLANEEINRTVTYDHISIVSEQSCKKYKDRRKRKNVITDKVDSVCPNKNQLIEVSPNQKKFKIEIDCNNKFRINISCNGVQFDKEMAKTECEVLEDSSVKGLFKSASGKDILIDKRKLNEAKKKLEEINAYSEKDDISPKKELCDDNLVESQKNNNDYCHLSSAGKDKLIKKFLNKAHKLYRDIRKSDVLLNPDKKLEKMREIDSDMKSIQKINDNCVQTAAPMNHCGFKSASGKEIKVSAKALKTAKKMYEDTDKLSNENNQYRDSNADSLNQSAENSEMKDSEILKQRTRILYTDMDNTYPNSKIPVPDGCKLISGKLLKNQTNSESEKIYSQTIDLQNFQKQVLQPNACGSKLTEFVSGFQSASGRNISIPSGAIAKAKRLFEEHNFPAGDSPNQSTLFSGFKSASGKDIQISDERLVEAKKMYETCDNAKLCMGDFKENLQETDQMKFSPEKISEPLQSNSSKKAFEILEDVVETVDCALEKIQKSKNQRVNKKRLGVSRCKQINISKEKIETAKRLFSSESIVELPITSPLRATGTVYNSTPLRNNVPQIKDVNFSKSSIESEITPIKHTDHEIINCSTNDPVGDSDIILYEKTTGTLDDWYATISRQINSVKDILKNLEGKKSNLEKQMSLIHYSDKDHRKRRSGVLYKNKTTHSSRLPLKSLNTAVVWTHEEDLLHSTPITPINVHKIHFNCNRLENIGPTQDGAVVIPNSQNLVGLSEIEMAFRTMPGVEPDLIPNKWIANHYRLIAWKLACYERFSPGQLKGSLSIENIIQQLKYRYDREIDRAERSAIRKFLEKDDVPQKRMVLCVSNIFEGSNNRKELELTDGWYCIRTIIDNPLMYQINAEKIKIGTKLVINGAQLLNCEGCHPLQVPDFVKLKITYNCTRRSIWHTKLGYQKCPEPFPIPMSSIHPDGGLIGCIKINIIRVYPIRYMEQIEDKKVWRNSKAEEKRANDFENERLAKIERIHYSIQENFERDLCKNMKNKIAERSKLNKTEILKITCPKTLYGLLESANDPESLIEVLSPSQRVSVLEYRQYMSLQREQEISKRISEEMEKLKLTKRKVIPILKLLVLDSYIESEKPQQFCIWNPKDEDLSLLKEGVSVTVYNVLPRPNGDLFSNAKTYFIMDKNCTTFSKFRRQIFPIIMTLDPHYQPFFNEFDTIGLVIQININNHDQNIWIADCLGRLLYIKIKDGPKMCSLLDGITKGDIVSLLNLIYCNPQKEFGQAVANQFTVISNCAHQNYLQEYVEQMKLQLPKDPSKLIDECEQNIEKYILKLQLKQNIRASPIQHLKSFNNSTFETSDDSTLISSRLTATDLAMSLIDTEKFT